MMSSFDLSGKTALCSGGAKGIGAAMAIGLAQAGCDIVLLQRDPNATDTKSEIRGLGRKCDIIECDISNRSTTTNVLRTVLETRQIDILLNAAGTQRRLPAEDMTDEALDDVLNTNLTGLFTICRTVGAHWLAQGQTGVIVNVASLAAMQGGINMSAYAASKGGVLQLTKALSNEWAGRGIRVNCVSPGYIETDINKDTRTNPDLKANFDFITSRIPMGHWGKAADLAGVAVFLASTSASGYVTGENIVVDGGFMAR